MLTTAVSDSIIPAFNKTEKVKKESKYYYKITCTFTSQKQKSAKLQMIGKTARTYIDEVFRKDVKKPRFTKLKRLEKHMYNRTMYQSHTHIYILSRNQEQQIG